MNNDQHFIAEAYSRMYLKVDEDFQDQKPTDVKVGPGEEVQSGPFKYGNHQVYYSTYTEKGDDDITVYHALITKNGNVANHIELTGRETFTPEEVQQYIDAKMPLSYDMQKAGVKQVGGSFSKKEFHAYLDKLKQNNNEDDETEEGEMMVGSNDSPIGVV
jgi:hypothetical protein